jgi:2,3-bisphosphoglycerate-dependent phosphoglycerate mutase
MAPPPQVRTTPPPAAEATRVVLVRHGEAVCNVEGVVGGRTGCRGLTGAGAAQVSALAGRLAASGELAGVAALYSSVLPRALETAAILAPALDRWRDGPPLDVAADCDLCELHPGQADGLTWAELAERYPEPDWDADPARPLAPGGESWAGFVDRAAAAVARLADAHPGELVVAACHAGVIEATLLRFLATDRERLRLPTAHASLTVWQRLDGEWTLRRYNDVTPPQPA